MWKSIAVALLTPSALLASGGGGQAMVLVADSRRFSGWEAWWANLYNESHLVFAILTVVAVAGLAMAMGKITDMLLARTGINLKSRVLTEH